jgi:flagellar assembly factor FliW
MTAPAEVRTESVSVNQLDDVSVIVFSEGLVGQPQWRRFVLLSAEDQGAVGILQSLDDEMLSMMVTWPNLVLPEYTVVLNSSDRAALELEVDEQPTVLTTVSVHGELITTNLVGPLVINPRTLAARQVVLSDGGYSTTHPLGQLGAQE